MACGRDRPCRCSDNLHARWAHSAHMCGRSWCRQVARTCSRCKLCFRVGTQGRFSCAAAAWLCPFSDSANNLQAYSAPLHRLCSLLPRHSSAFMPQAPRVGARCLSVAAGGKGKGKKGKKPESEASYLVCHAVALSTVVSRAWLQREHLTAVRHALRNICCAVNVSACVR